jgi:hypothetical protein
MDGIIWFNDTKILFNDIQKIPYKFQINPNESFSQFPIIKMYLSSEWKYRIDENLNVTIEQFCYNSKSIIRDIYIFTFKKYLAYSDPVSCELMKTTYAELDIYEFWKNTLIENENFDKDGFYDYHYFNSKPDINNNYTSEYIIYFNNISDLDDNTLRIKTWINNSIKKLKEKKKIY